MASKPTLHHLDHSQSQRILWLMEELRLAYGLDYNCELHFRQQKDKLAPPSLKAVSSTGSAPAFVTADGRTIAESNAIATYVLRTYDTEAKFGGGPRVDDVNKVDWIRDEEITSFASTSFGSIVFQLFILDVMYNMSPWLFKPLIALVRLGLGQAFKPRLKLQLKWLESRLGEVQGGYFMGAAPGRADFMLSFPMDMCADRKMDDLSGFPKIKAWQDRCRAREGWISAINRGNGYSWNHF